MTVAGDLHWERIRAGHYETAFWANGYKYKIAKSTCYGNIWYAYYKWDKWTANQYWKSLSISHGEFETLKAAKKACEYHNLHPRKKYKFIGRAKKSELRYYRKDFVNFLKFVQVDENGKELPYYVRYMNPKEIGGPDQEAINLEKYKKETDRLSKGKL